MKIGFFITARLKSSRLKQKIILPINGDRVLDKVILNCKATSGINGVLLCTSTNSQDSKLFEYALKHKIQFFAGSEDDVLQRLLDAAKYYNYDGFVSITADNPLHSTYIADLIVDWVDKVHSDFIFVSGLPIGLTGYYINTKALEIAIAMKKESDTEIWGPFVNRPDFFKIGYLNVENDLFPDNARFTCDYLADFQFLSSVYSCFDGRYSPSIFELSRLIADNKIKLSNSSISQSYNDSTFLQKVAKDFDQQKKLGLEVALKINHVLKPGKNILNVKL